MDRIVIIPNIMRDDVKIKRLFKHVEENVFNAKALNVELFEMSVRLMLYDCGILMKQDLVDSALMRMAVNSSPSPNMALSEDDVDNIIDDQYECIRYASDELAVQLARRIQPVIELNVPLNDKFRRVLFYYGIPSASAITLQLTNTEDEYA